MSAVAPGIPEYLTAAEVSGLYGVTARQVCIWARAGKIAGTRTPGGRSWRFPAAQFADLIRAAGGIPPQRGSAS
jgi:excisionase family DNA binding protein